MAIYSFIIFYRYGSDKAEYGILQAPLISTRGVVVCFHQGHANKRSDTCLVYAYLTQSLRMSGYRGLCVRLLQAERIWSQLQQKNINIILSIAA